MSRALICCLGAVWLLSACKPDPCKETVCENGGTCLDGACQCPEGFRGISCETFDLEAYLGEFAAEYSGCFTTSPGHRVLLESIPGSGNRIYLTNLGDYACPGGELRPEASLNGTQMTLPRQTLSCGSIAYTFEGSGNFDGVSRLTLTFEVSYDAGGFTQTDRCSAVMERVQ
jgi:hypothetical protein